MNTEEAIIIIEQAVYGRPVERIDGALSLLAENARLGQLVRDLPINHDLQHLSDGKWCLHYEDPKNLLPFSKCIGTTPEEALENLEENN